MVIMAVSSQDVPLRSTLSNQRLVICFCRQNQDLQDYRVPSTWNDLLFGVRIYYNLTGSASSIKESIQYTKTP